MLFSIDSCIDVATAITADRTPIFLASACLTMVVALLIWAELSGMFSCGPKTPTGRNWSAAGSAPLAIFGSLRCAWNLATWFHDKSLGVAVRFAVVRAVLT